LQGSLDRICKIFSRNVKAKMHAKRSNSWRNRAHGKLGLLHRHIRDLHQVIAHKINRVPPEMRVTEICHLCVCVWHCCIQKQVDIKKVISRKNWRAIVAEPWFKSVYVMAKKQRTSIIFIDLRIRTRIENCDCWMKIKSLSNSGTECTLDGIGSIIHESNNKCRYPSKDDFQHHRIDAALGSAFGLKNRPFVIPTSH
jgi:hypothetical protein